jgi:hypothetical protein
LNLKILETTMDTNRYNLAAWMSFASAAIILPMVVTNFMFGAGHTYLLPFLTTLELGSIVLSVYVMLKLLDLLRRQYNNNRLEIPVYVSLVMGALTTLTGISLNVLGICGIPALLIMALPIVPMAVAGIVIGVRLLAMPADLHGLKKPLGLLYIISSACYLTLFLIPLGLMVCVVESIVLGMVFLRAGSQEIPEFV